MSKEQKAVLITFYAPDADAFMFVVPKPQPDFLRRLRAYGVYAATNDRLWETASGTLYYYEVAMLVEFLRHTGGMGPKKFKIDRHMKEHFTNYVSALREDMHATPDELIAFRDAMTGWKDVEVQAITAARNDVVIPVNVMINTAYIFPVE